MSRNAHAHLSRASSANAGVQSVDRALRLLKAVAAADAPSSAQELAQRLRGQPQHGLAPARDAGGSRARRARCRDRALRRRLRRVPARERRGSRRARPPAASAARAHGRGHGRDRDARDGQALRPRLRRPGRSAGPAVTRLERPPHPPARDVVRQGLPGVDAGGGARGRAAGRARALHPAHDRRPRTSSTASSSACGATATRPASASTTTPTASRRRSSTRNHRPIAIVNVWGPSLRVTRTRLPALGRAALRAAHEMSLLLA